MFLSSCTLMQMHLIRSKDQFYLSSSLLDIQFWKISSTGHKLSWILAPKTLTLKTELTYENNFWCASNVLCPLTIPENFAQLDIFVCWLFGLQQPSCHQKNLTTQSVGRQKISQYLRAEPRKSIDESNCPANDCCAVTPKTASCRLLHGRCPRKSPCWVFLGNHPPFSMRRRPTCHVSSFVSILELSSPHITKTQQLSSWRTPFYLFDKTCYKQVFNTSFVATIFQTEKFPINTVILDSIQGGSRGNGVLMTLIRYVQNARYEVCTSSCVRNDEAVYFSSDKQDVLQ